MDITLEIGTDTHEIRSTTNEIRATTHEIRTTTHRIRTTTQKILSVSSSPLMDLFEVLHSSLECVVKQPSPSKTFSI